MNDKTEEQTEVTKPKNLSIKILNKDEFYNLVLEYLNYEMQGWDINDIIKYNLENGFPKLEFDNLNSCLNKMQIYLPTVAVDFGDCQFYWVVSGRNAIIVNKQPK